MKTLAIVLIVLFPVVVSAIEVPAQTPPVSASAKAVADQAQQQGQDQAQQQAQDQDQAQRQGQSQRSSNRNDNRNDNRNTNRNDNTNNNRNTNQNNNRNSNENRNSNANKNQNANSNTNQIGVSNSVGVENQVASNANSNSDSAATSNSSVNFNPDIRTGDVSIGETLVEVNTGDVIVGETSVTVGGTAVEAGDVTMNIEAPEREINPHAPYVPPAYSQPVFSPSLGLSGAGADFQFAVMRLCAGQFGETSRKKSKVAEISYTSFRAPEATVENPAILLLESSGLEVVESGQRFRCVGLVSVEARRKKAEHGHLVTLVNEMNQFASSNLLGSSSGIFAVLDPCISRNAGVVTNGAGVGGSTGGSGFVGDALSTILAGANAGRGRTFNLTQLGVGALFVILTADTGPGTFTSANLSQVLDALADAS